MAQRASAKKKGEILVNVQVNADDEIDLVPVERHVWYEDGQEEDDDDEEDLSENMDSDPDLVRMKDGRLMLTLKRNKACAKCKKPFKTSEELETHKPKCTGAMDEVTDVFLKERKAAKHANPSEEFHKYCNPNPENPCHCCGEDISTAHVGHIRCRFCPKSFKAYVYLERHIRTVHSESDEFPCTFCNAKCASLEVQQEHLATHSEGKPFSCITCGKEFTRRYHLERHVKHSNCGSEPKLTLPCEVCGREFTRVDNLREHLRSHIGQTGRKRDYQCPHCSKSFYGSSLLNIHIRTHTGEKPFPCDLCPKSFPSSGALRKHRRKHTGERPYRCDDCSATFGARETLNRHRKTHTGVKPHECKECGKRFIQATQLRTHMFTHNGADGYKCKLCDKMFGRKSKLNEHIKYDHLGEPPLECNECGKTFLRRDELTRHMAVHSNTKEFQCAICNNRYSRKSALTLHMKTHSSEDPAKCKICSKIFIRMDCLVRHVKKSHPDYLSELIEYTEKRKEEEILASKPDTVEINGEVYQITPLNDEVKEPAFVLPDRDDKEAVGSVEVLNVVELPMIMAEDAEATLTENSRIYEFLPITEETEIIIEAEHQETPDGAAVPEAVNLPVQATSDTGSEDQVTVEKEIQSEGTVAPLKVVKPTVKVGSSRPTELIPMLKTETRQKPAQPVAVARSKQQSATDTISPKPTNDGKIDKKLSKPKSTPIIAKETKPRTPRASKGSPTGTTKESVGEPVKRRQLREPKAPGRKRKRSDDDSIPIFLSDDMLGEKITELLQMLVGEEMLREFGWPETPVEELLCQVVLRCGHRPTKGEDAGDHTTRMRENTKILFSVTMDDDDIKALLNNHTVDEVIMHVLKTK